MGVDGAVVLVATLFLSGFIGLKQCAGQQALVNCDGTGLDEDFLIAHQTTSQERYVSVAALPSLGGTAFAIIYEARTSSGEYDVWTRVFENKESLSNGSVPTMRVNTQLSSNQGTSSIAAVPTSNGNTKFVAAWESAGGQDGSEYGAYSRVFTYSGGSLQGATSEFQLDNQTLQNQRAPHIVPLSNEAAVFSWFTEVQNRDVAIRAFNVSSGVALTDRRLVSSTEDAWALQGDQHSAKVVELTNGSLATVFEDSQNDEALIRIFNYNLGTSALTDVVPMFAFAPNISDSLSGIRSVDIASLPNNNFVCLVSAAQGLFVRRYHIDGSELSVLERVDPRGYNGGAPAVHTVPDGGFLVSWAATEDTNQDIYVRRYYADGGSTDIMVVNNRDSAPGSNLGAADVAVLGDGVHVFVAWQDTTGLDGATRGLFGNIFCLSEVNTDIAPSTPVHLCSGSKFDGDILLSHETVGEQNRPRVAALPSLSNTAFVVTYNSPGTGEDTFVRVFEDVNDLLYDRGSAAKRVNTYLTNNQFPHSITVVDGQSAPTFTVGWTSTGGQDGDSRGAYIRTFEYMDGIIANITDEIRLDNQTSGQQENPKCFATEDDVGLCVWYTDMSGRDMAIRLLNFTTGQALTERWLVTDDGSGIGFSGNQFGNNVGRLGNSTFVHGFREGSTNSVQVRAFNFDFSTGVVSDIAAVFVVNTQSLLNVKSTDLEVLKDNSFVVAFSANEGVFRRRFSSSLVPFDSSLRVDTGLEDGSNVNVVALPDGGYIVGWDDGTGNATVRDVYIQRYDAADDPVGPITVLSNAMRSGTGSYQYYGMEVLGDGEHVVAVWAELDGEDGDGKGVFGNVFCLGDPPPSTGRVVSCDFNQCNLSCPEHMCRAGDVQTTPLVLSDLPLTVPGRWMEVDEGGNAVLLVDSVWEDDTPYVEVSSDAVDSAMEVDGAQSFLLAVHAEVSRAFVRDVVLLTYQFSPSPEVGRDHSGWILSIRPDGRFVASFRPFRSTTEGLRVASTAPVEYRNGLHSWTVFWNVNETLPRVYVDGDEISTVTEYFRPSDNLSVSGIAQPGVMYFGEIRSSACERPFIGADIESNIVLYDNLSLQVTSSSSFDSRFVLFDSKDEDACSGF